MTVKNDRRAPTKPLTADEIATMVWCNSMMEAERAKELELAGRLSGGTWTPSAADAWACF